VGYAIGLTGELGQIMLAARYGPEGLAALRAGKGLDGRLLPAKAYMAGRRLGWACPQLLGVYLTDRFRRTVEEQVVRRLRQSVWLGQVVDGLLRTWPEGPKQRTPEEWAALWQAVPQGTDKATVRDRTRQVAAYLNKAGHMPSGICDLEPEAGFGPVLALAPRKPQTLSHRHRGPKTAGLATLKR
jgi:hypothetical protein